MCLRKRWNGKMPFLFEMGKAAWSAAMRAVFSHAELAEYPGYPLECALHKACINAILWAYRNIGKQPMLREAL